MSLLAGQQAMGKLAKKQGGKVARDEEARR